MGEQDRLRWDDRYSHRDARREIAGPPADFAAHAETFPITGTALDIACGQGHGSIWLAQRGLTVHGIDVSAVAIDHARATAAHHEVTARCTFTVADLDHGLPPGPAVDVILCQRFRDRRLDQVIVERLAPGGLLAVSALSEVGGTPGPFRVAAGELPAAFPGLDMIAAGEGDGVAWLVARRR